MRKTALYFSLLAATFTLAPLSVIRTQKSGSIPVDIDMQDVTSIYKEVDSSLYYYKISASNASLEYKVRLSSQETYNLGYQKADSADWEYNFWKPFYIYESTCLGLTGLITLSDSENSCKTLCIGGSAALLGLFIQNLRHNKAADLSSHMIVGTAYKTIESTPTQSYTVPGFFVDEIKITDHGKVFKTKKDSFNSVVISVNHPLQNIEIDIAQMGTFYEIYLTEK